MSSKACWFSRLIKRILSLQSCSFLGLYSSSHSNILDSKVVVVYLFCVLTGDLGLCGTTRSHSNLAIELHKVWMLVSNLEEEAESEI